MLNVMLVGGSKVEDVAKAVQDDKYTIVKVHPYVMDAFDDIIKNNAIYLDLDVLIVIQHGIASDIPAEEQIKDLQELLSVSRIDTKLYFALTDQELYDELAESEEAIQYDKTRILIHPKLYQKTIRDIIEGKMDDSGIAAEAEEEVDEYVEEDIEQDEEENVFTAVRNIEEESPEKEGSTDIGDLRGRKKKGIIPGLGVRLEKDKDKENERVERPERKMTEPTPRRQPMGRHVHSDTVPIKYRGVIAVTGDRNTGVSTTAANLAETFAANGSTVLIIDLDFKRRSQSIYYNELASYRHVNESTQQGVYFGLSNADNIEKSSIIVKDNTALLGMSRDSEYYGSPFVEKSVEYLESSNKISTLVGFAKGNFDIVMLDFPLEYMKKFIDATIIVDKFIVCVENNILSVDNMFSLELAELNDLSEVHAETFIAKSSVILTKYTSASGAGRYEVDENLVENHLKNNVFGGVRVIGRTTYSEDYFRQMEGTKRVIDLNGIAREEYRKIAAEISKR